MVKSVNVVDECSVRSAVSELLWHLKKERPFCPVSYIVQRYIVFRARFISNILNIISSVRLPLCI